MAERKVSYLGDSVYAEIEDGMVKLTTSDGHTTSNTIYLEPMVYTALRQFVRRSQWLEPNKEEEP